MSEQDGDLDADEPEDPDAEEAGPEAEESAATEETPAAKDDENDAENEEAAAAAADEEGSEDTEASADADELDPEAAASTLEEIAQEPEGDVTAALNEIATGGDDDSEQVIEASIEPEDITVEEELVENVAEAPPETLASVIAMLRAELAELENDLEAARERADDFESRLKRKQADFQNYKKRAKKRQQQIKDRATEDLVERLLGVRDNMKRALEEESGDADSLRDGVEMTLREFDRVLEDENVSEIDPEPGTESDPQRHEVMMRVDSALPEGTIADVYTPGYEMGEKVIQNAQVTVSNGELEADVDEDSPAAADSDDSDAGDEAATEETAD